MTLRRMLATLGFVLGAALSGYGVALAQAGPAPVSEAGGSQYLWYCVDGEGCLCSGQLCRGGTCCPE